MYTTMCWTHHIQLHDGKTYGGFQFGNHFLKIGLCLLGHRMLISQFIMEYYFQAMIAGIRYIINLKFLAGIFGRPARYYGHMNIWQFIQCMQCDLCFGIGFR